MAVSAVALRPRDRVRLALATGIAAGGCGLVQWRQGWLARAYCNGPRLRFGVSVDSGAIWADRQLAMDALAGESAPDLTADWHDTLWLVYHRSAGTAIMRSDDMGASVEEISTIASISFPAICWTPEHLLLSAHGPTGLELRASANAGETWGLIGSLPGASPLTRAQLILDRHGLLHLYYESSGGEILHRWSAGLGSGWSDPAILAASGSAPAAALGDTGGLLFYWQGTQLRVTVLRDGGDGTDGPAPIPAASYVRQSLASIQALTGDYYVLGVGAGGAELAWCAGPGSGWGVVT
jgi:hypothetical protein